jgi:hypothetical protein
MVRSPKSIAGAVRATSGNAAYKIGVLLRSAFGIALQIINRYQPTFRKLNHKFMAK